MLFEAFFPSELRTQLSASCNYVHNNLNTHLKMKDIQPLTTAFVKMVEKGAVSLDMQDLAVSGLRDRSHISAIVLCDLRTVVHLQLHTIYLLP